MKNLFKKDNLLTIVMQIPLDKEVQSFITFMEIIFKYVQKNSAMHNTDEYIGIFEIKESKYEQLTKELADNNLRIIRTKDELVFTLQRVEPA